MKIATSLEPVYTPQCSPNILDRRYRPTDAIHFRLRIRPRPLFGKWRSIVQPNRVMGTAADAADAVDVSPI